MPLTYRRYSLIPFNPNLRKNKKIDKNTNNKTMIFYDFLYTGSGFLLVATVAYKDIWTLLVYPSVP